MIFSLGLLLLLGSAAGADSRPAILFFGDSLTAGWGIDRDEAYPALIQGKLDEAGLPFEAVNAGLSGETSAGGLRRVDWILRRPIDVFVLELGANDGLRGVPPEVTHRNLQAIIERVRERQPHARIVIAGMLLPENFGKSHTDRFAQIFPKLAAENGATLIPFFLEGVGGNPEYNLPDGVHPNPEGHALIAETIWEHLEPLLRSLAAERGARGVAEDAS